MYLTWIVYGLFVLMLAAGGRFTGFGKDKFHEDPMDPQAIRSLRGFAAVGVVLHHISQEQALQSVGELGLFVNAGYLFVSIFLFCSGYGLYVSMKNKPGYLEGFPKRRLKYILVPFYVTTLAYALYKLLTGTKLPAGQWITGLLGLTTLNRFAWYPIVIVLLYIAFWLFFRKAEKPGGPVAGLFVLVLVFGAIFCVEGHLAWWAEPENWWLYGKDAPWWTGQDLWWFHGEWWVNSAVAFPLGVAFAANREKLNAWLKKGYWLKLAVCLFLCVFFRRFSMHLQSTVGYWSEYSRQGPAITDKLICFAGQLPEIGFFVTTLYMILFKYRAVNPAGRFFGGISLENYLMNIIPIEGFRFLLYNSSGGILRKPGHLNLIWYAVIVFAVTTLLGWLFHTFDNWITKKKDLS